MDAASNSEAVDYRRLFKSLPNPYIAFLPNDPIFTIIEENEAHAVAALSKPENAIGKPVFEVFPDNSEKYKTTGVSDLQESFRKVIRTGKPDIMPLLNYDVRDKHGNFVEKWWRVTHYPVFGARGELLMLYQATEDITNETEANKKYELAQSQLNSALGIGLVSTWYWDIENNVVIGDKNLAKSFGIKPDMAAKGLPLETFTNSIHLDDQTRVVDAIQRAVISEHVFEEEYRTINNKGTERWVIARGKTERDPSGKVAYFLGVLVDITDRKQAELMLAQTENMFNALFESSIMGIVMADLNGNIMQANKMFLKTFGYTKADLKKGINSIQLTPLQSIGTTTHIYDSLRTTGEIEPTEKEYLRKDGSKIPILVGGAMLPNSRDLFMAFLLDISETKELKALNDAKDDFIALASHQLRTPATAVKQYLGVLLEGYAGEFTPNQHQYLTIANNSNERQLMIINDLLKTAQLDTKGHILQLANHDLLTVIKDIIDQVKPVTDGRQQTIVFNHQPGKLLVHIDSNELKLALINLVENASKYTPVGKQITITAERLDKRVTITVADQGVGIAKKDQEVIFDKFTRVNNPLSDTVNGSGLGLYWVKRIVNLHGGDIQVISAVNKGSRFVIHLTQ